MSSPVFADLNATTGATDFSLGGDRAAPTGALTPLGARFLAGAHPAPGLVGVHLLAHGTDRMYSDNRSAIANAVRTGYIDRGVEFWVGSSSTCGSAIHRFTRNGVSSYAVTTADRQRLSAGGWIDSGLAFRAQPVGSFRWPTTSTKGPLDLQPYNNPDSLAWKAYRTADTRSDRQSMYQIAATPTAIWLGPSGDIARYVNRITTAADAMDEAPQFVLYAIPDRDCGGYAAGGYSDAASYRRWIDDIHSGLAGRPAVVIVEPDAIGMSCLSASQADTRTSLLRYALRTLSSDPAVWVYLHAGSSGIDPTQMASSLQLAGIGYARGFAVNVSGFDTTTNEITYGHQILAALASDGLPGKHFVVDTSRNGAGRPPAGSTGDVPQWCNPPGRALGVRPTPSTGDPDVDAFLWIKPPGESDGPCYPGQPATGWFNAYAEGLVTSGLQRQTIADLPTP